MKEKILTDLYNLIEERKKDLDSKEKSYTRKMLRKGINHISKKFGEEAVEVVIAAHAESKERLISESADMLYHLLVLWNIKEIEPDLVMEELTKRFKKKTKAKK